MNGYQKLKEQLEAEKRGRRFDSKRATAYFFALVSYIPEEKKNDAASLIEQLLKEEPLCRDVAHLDPAVQMLRMKNENR